MFGRGLRSVSAAESQARDEALVDVYLRQDAYYLSVKARTTAGLWVAPGEAATTLPVDAGPDALGAE